MRAEVEFSGEILNYRKDGTPFWNDLTITPVLDESGALGHFVGITRDITELKRTQAALAATRTEADAAIRSRSAFLANMSHEIRTSLNAILGLSRLLQRDSSVPEQSIRLDQIERATENLLALAYEWLDPSEVMSGSSS